MFGLIFGTVCLVALVASLRRRHYYAHYAGYGHHRGYGGRHGYRRGGGRDRFAMRWLFEELDTTPGQEKAILKSVETLREHLADSRSELGTARKELAAALGGDELDQPALNAALQRVDGLVDRARAEVTQVLSETHAALNGEQRKQLAELIADFRGHRHGYGYC